IPPNRSKPAPKINRISPMLNLLISALLIPYRQTRISARKIKATPSAPTPHRDPLHSHVPFHFSLLPFRRRLQSAGAHEAHCLYPGANGVSVPDCSPVWSKLLTHVFATCTYLLGLKAGV